MHLQIHGLLVGIEECRGVILARCTLHLGPALLNKSEVHKLKVLVVGVFFFAHPNIGEVTSTGAIQNRDRALIALVGTIGSQNNRFGRSKHIAIEVARTASPRFQHTGGFRSVDAVITAFDEVRFFSVRVEVSGVTIDFAD